MSKAMQRTDTHVLDEVEAYARLTSIGSYCVRFDTEDLVDTYPDRPWDHGSSPNTTVDTFFRSNARDGAATSADSKLKIAAASGGYLRRLA